MKRILLRKLYVAIQQEQTSCETTAAALTPNIFQQQQIMHQ